MSFETEIESIPDLADTQRELIKLLKKVGQRDATIFFDCASKLIDGLNIKENDKRLTYGTSGNNRFTITIGQRYCLSLFLDQEFSWGFIHITKSSSNDGKNVTKYDGSPKAYYSYCHSSAEMADGLSEILAASEEELSRTKISGYRKHNNILFENALFNTDFRMELFDSAFRKRENMLPQTNYYVLGAAWYGNEDSPDQTERFLKEGIWENGYRDKFFEIVNNVNIGDRVAIKSIYATKTKRAFLRIKALGTVTGNENNGRILRITWDPRFEPYDLEGYGGGYRNTIYMVPNEDVDEIFYHDSNNKNTMNMDADINVTHSLNTILYGPPGTGKTYTAIKKSSEILTGKDYTNKYEDAKIIYRKNLGDQIEFITFHQNYSYEDFIAGIRPDTDVEGQMVFKEHKGIFYDICDRARKNLINSQTKTSTREPDFDDILDIFLKPLRDNSQEIRLETKSDKVPFYITKINLHNLSFRKNSGGTGHTLSFNTLRDVYEGKRIYPYTGVGIYLNPVAIKLKELAKGQPIVSEPEDLKNYILIIDEINRANISRVFGELITLLEDDKRLGNKHEMQISLPNGERFSVPKNLYIIGTMNTADKSIALIDIALRRRFVFEDMYPRPELVNQLIRNPLNNFLNSLNERILKEKGADFLVGHAYFISEEGDNINFCSIMNNKIVPLLNEYFYNTRNNIVFDILQEAIKEVKSHIIEKDIYLGVICKKSN